MSDKRSILINHLHWKSIMSWTDPLRIYRYLSNVPNFGPTIYRHEPIDHDDYIDVLFLGQRPHCIWTWWFVLYIGRNPIVDDIYVYICFVLGMDPEAHDWWNVCVGRGPWSTWLMKCLGMNPESHDRWDVLCWARGSGTHEYLHLCWA